MAGPRPSGSRRRPPEQAGRRSESFHDAIRATLAALPPDLADYANDEDAFEELLLAAPGIRDHWAKLKTHGDRLRFLTALRALWWSDRRPPPEPSPPRERRALRRARQRLQAAAAVDGLRDYLRGYIVAVDARLAKRSAELDHWQETVKRTRRGRPGRPRGAINATVAVVALSVLLTLRPVQILPIAKHFAPKTFDQPWVTAEHLAARIRDARHDAEIDRYLQRLRRLKGPPEKNSVRRGK